MCQLTKCLVALLPDVVSNTQNRALKKRKLDSNPRYSPDFIGSHKHSGSLPFVVGKSGP